MLHKKLLHAFIDAKSSRTISRSMMSKIFFSIQHVAKPFNPSCNIVDLKQFLSSFKLEKLLSAEKYLFKATLCDSILKNTYLKHLFAIQ
jgi:hypothetical protein